jgi:hypothetical protein
MLDTLCILLLLAVGAILGTVITREPIRDSRPTWPFGPPGR